MWETLAQILGSLFDLLDNCKDLCDQYLFEQIVDLIDDEEAEIWNLCVRMIPHFGKFSSEIFKEKGISVLINLLEQWDDNTDYIMTNSGEIMYNLRHSLFDSDEGEALQFQNLMIDLIKEYSEDPPEDVDEAPK